MAPLAVFGRYQLGKRLGKGGMGEVFLAKQLGPMGFEKPLALKLLLPHLGQDAEGVESFLAEGRLAARMNHPNIVQILDMGQASDRYFMAMELVEGVSLSTLMARLAQAGERPAAPLVSYVAWALCTALDYAHGLTDTAGQPLALVHRDVSPQNVLVSLNGDVKLTDFGIAKIKGSSSDTEPGTVKGKLEYLAPEALAGGGVDLRADLFSAGVTLYALATQTSPFRRDSPSATMSALEKDEPPSLATLRPDLPPPLVDAIARAMRKAPGERFASAREFRSALTAPSEIDREALAGLVRRHCTQELQELHEGTQRMLLGRTATLDEKPTERVDGRALRRRVVVAGVAVSLLGALAVAGLRASAPPPPPLNVATVVREEAAPVEDAGAAVVVEPLPQPEVEASPPPRSPVVETGAGNAKPSAKTATGRLDIDASPWAVVYINGKHAGETPLAGYPVLAGQVRITLHNPDTGQRVNRTLQVPAGGRVSVKEKLK